MSRTCIRSDRGHSISREKSLFQIKARNRPMMMDFYTLTRRASHEIKTITWKRTSTILKVHVSSLKDSIFPSFRIKAASHWQAIRSRYLLGQPTSHFIARHTRASPIKQIITSVAIARTNLTCLNLKSIKHIKSLRFTIIRENISHHILKAS